MTEFVDIYDPVYHKAIRLKGVLKVIIDTPEFQRLHRIHQLGMTWRVYPTARHTRFEHSIGTCYLAGKLLRKLRKTLPEAEQHVLTDRMVCAVEIAALCHDLGHGPFSHLFEDILKKNGNTQWNHEDASCAVLRHLVFNNEAVRKLFEKDPIKALNVDEIDQFLELVNQLIRGEANAQYEPFLFQIVHNEENTFDVDKIDYIMRDLMFARGVTGVIQYERLFNCAKLMKDSEQGRYQICFRDKVADEIIDIFGLRSLEHRAICMLQSVKRIESMIIECIIQGQSHIADALQLRSNWLESLSTSSDDVEILLRLDDHSVTSAINRSPQNAAAWMTMRRIEQRKLFPVLAKIKVIGECNEETVEAKFRLETERAGIAASKWILKVLKFTFPRESKAKRFWFFKKADTKCYPASEFFVRKFTRLSEAHSYSNVFIWWNGDENSDGFRHAERVAREFAGKINGVLEM